MKNSFKVILNKQIIYTYTDKTAPARLRRFLDEMDNHMQSGIKLGNVSVENPTDFQKLQYVAVQLFHALDTDNENLVEVMSAYLMKRNCQLSEINITQEKITQENTTQENDLFNIQLT